MNQPRVSRLSVGRLCNLGNYEHIRYEVTVDIPEGVDVTKTLMTVEKALNTLAQPAPGRNGYPTVAYAKAQLAKPISELQPAHEQENLGAYRRLVEAYEAWTKRQDYARAVLGDFSLSSEFTDHKQYWDEDGDWESRPDGGPA